MILLIFCTASLASVLAEPPVGRLYLPPGQQPSSLTSSGRFGGARSLSTQYGAPASGRFGGAGGLSTQYGAPASGRFGAAGGLSTQYGAPSSGRLGGAGSLSTQYGAPASERFGGAPGLSAQYGAPDLGGVGGPRGLSTQYGAPGFGRAGGSRSQYAPSGGYNYGRGGYSSEDDVLSEPANYEFSYEVDDLESGSEFGHEENRQDEDARGSYHVLLPDGRRQIVEYEADFEGYKPQIRYEDTGAEAYQTSRGAGGPY